MDLDSALQEAAEAIGLTGKKTRKKRSDYKKKKGKQTVAATKRKVGRPAKEVAPASKPKKLPKTKLLSMRFFGDSVDLTFRDLRKLRTPLKYLDKRLAKLAPKELRQVEISRNGKTISWAEQGILVDVAYAMHFED